MKDPYKIRVIKPSLSIGDDVMFKGIKGKIIKLESVLENEFASIVFIELSIPLNGCSVVSVDRECFNIVTQD